jgi:hypothetical protein
MSSVIVDLNEALTLEFTDPEGQVRRGSVEEVRRETSGLLMVVNFRPTQVAAHPIGEAIDLSFSGVSLRRPVRVRARVVCWTENEVLERYEFQFDEEASLALGPAFNRRGAVRVNPAPRAPIVAEIFTDEHWVEASTVQDISTGGVSLLLHAEDPGGLSSYRQLYLRLRLPNDDEERFEVAGIVRFRRLSGAAIAYGIEFDAARTEGFAAKQGRVHAYVMRRQLEVLRSCRP